MIPKMGYSIMGTFNRQHLPEVFNVEKLICGWSTWQVASSTHGKHRSGRLCLYRHSEWEQAKKKRHRLFERHIRKNGWVSAQGHRLYIYTHKYFLRLVNARINNATRDVSQHVRNYAQTECQGRTSENMQDTVEWVECQIERWNVCRIECQNVCQIECHGNNFASWIL